MAAAERLRPTALSWTAAPPRSRPGWLGAATGLGCGGREVRPNLRQLLYATCR